jgi:hypothetical protein
MTRRMAEAVSEGFRLAGSALDSFLKTREEPIEDPVETIRKIAEARRKKDDNSFYTGEGLCLLICLPMGEPRFRVGPRDAARELAFLLTSY